MNRPPAFNAKARKSVAGGSRKKGKPKRKTGLLSATETVPDFNGDIITPKTQEQKDLEREARIVEEAQVDTRESKRKKRRSEKYVDAMLKKENRVQLLKNLAQTQATISTTGLQSSATLGSGRLRTHEQLAEKAEHHAVQKAIGGGRRHKRGRMADDDDDMSDSASDSANEHSSVRAHEAETSLPTHILPANDLPSTGSDPAVTVTSSSAVSTVVSVGSGLKRNADGSVTVPKIMPRKAKGAQTSFSAWGRQKTSMRPESDTSFDSSDSANDSDEDTSADSDSDSDEEWGGIMVEGVDLQETGLSHPVDYESGEGTSSGDDEMSSTKSSIRPKKLGSFKKWAIQQLSDVKEYIAPPQDDDRSPTPPLAPPPAKRAKTTHSSALDGLMRGPLGHTLQVPSTSLAKQLDAERNTREKIQVQVHRPPDVQATRLELPIVAEEQQIIEAITLNPVVIICGETGSGKTTQVPQFLYEAGYAHPGGDNPGMIGVTQPRRVAAMAMAERVAHELSLPPSRVSYQIRYDTTTSPTTAIKFMTDGVLLRELATDFLLTKYSVVIIDEAHERSLNTDILLGVLSRVVTLRMEQWEKKQEGVKPLRLIIMSATLRVSDFAQNSTLFPTPPPMVSVNARQYPVTVHFARKTDSDYVGAAVKKACKIHARLPPGGILIFLTGQNEISGVIRKLESKYGVRALDDRKRRRTSRTVQHHDDGLEGARVATAALVSIEAEDMELGDQPEDLAADVDQADAEDTLIDDEDLESNAEEGVSVDLDEDCETPMHIVPLYSLLPRDKQMKVFEPPPEGSRLVVVATNVAETSVTIPGIRYVIDCGRAKERRYEVNNGIQQFQVSWISKASAAQRAGRAGRTGPGHCYRLYSSPVFEHYFDEFSAPEISRVPIEGVVLQMKAMHIDAVTGFPFPTSPDRVALRKAEKTLVLLGALDHNSKSITELGKGMALFPLSPRYARMLVSGRQKGCLLYVIAMVAALSVGDPFIREAALEENEVEADAHDLAHLTSDSARAKAVRSIRRKAFFQSQHLHGSLGDFTSDVFRVLSVVGAYEFAKGGHAFCTDHFVRPKAMEEIHKLRGQISNIVETNFSGVPADFTHSLRPPNALQLKVLRQLITSAFIDQVAVRKDRVDATADAGNQYATANNVPYRAMDIDEDIYIHPSSLLATQAPPEYVVFSEVVRTSRIWMKGVTVVNPAWLSALGKPTLCTFSKPVKNAVGHMMVIPRFGPGWELPAIPAERM